MLSNNFAKLSPAQSNFNSIGWAELAFILFFYPPKGMFVGPSLSDEDCLSGCGHLASHCTGESPRNVLAGYDMAIFAIFQPFQIEFLWFKKQSWSSQLNQSN